MSNDKTYTLKVACTNCGMKGTATIPNGSLLSLTPCMNCGCQTLQPNPDKPKLG
jgi:rRNA maturation protein Nop10